MYMERQPKNRAPYFLSGRYINSEFGLRPFDIIDISNEISRNVSQNCRLLHLFELKEILYLIVYVVSWVFFMLPCHLLTMPK